MSDFNVSSLTASTAALVGAVGYPSAHGASGQFLSTTGSGVLQFITGVSPSSIGSAFGQLNAFYTTNLTTGDHLKLDTQGYATANVSVDTTTAYTTTANVASLGRITLAGGHAYLLSCVIPSCQMMSSANMTLNWFNADTNAAIGTANAFSNGNNNINLPQIYAYFNPSIATRVEVRFTVISNVSRITAASIFIHQIT